MFALEQPSSTAPFITFFIISCLINFIAIIIISVHTDERHWDWQQKLKVCLITFISINAILITFFLVLQHLRWEDYRNTIRVIKQPSSIADTNGGKS